MMEFNENQYVNSWVEHQLLRPYTNAEREYCFFLAVSVCVRLFVDRITKKCMTHFGEIWHTHFGWDISDEVNDR